jgi:hypothetical protein
MGAKKQQTHAKRARELAVRERRELKRAKKAEAAALRAAGGIVDGNGDVASPGPAEHENGAGPVPVGAR